MDESYDGIAMFLAIKAKSKEAVDRNDQLKYTKAMENIRDNKLADNVTAPEGFADCVNLFNSKINPYLEEPFTGAKLSSFILEFLPDALSTDKRALRRKLKSEGGLDDPEVVTERCFELVKDRRTWYPKTSRGLGCLPPSWLPSGWLMRLYRLAALRRRLLRMSSLPS